MSDCKPRARWCPYGVGYWIVRTIERGVVYQGVGYSISGAYLGWFDTRMHHGQAK